jgi:hypothetical protein
MGNDLNSYDERFIKTILSYLKQRRKESSYGDSADNVINNNNIDNSLGDIKALENYLWNFHKWSFIAPTEPLTIFLDCRTLRCFDNIKGPPRLLNDDELKFELLHIKQTTRKVIHSY